MASCQFQAFLNSSLSNSTGQPFFWVADHQGQAFFNYWVAQMSNSSGSSIGFGQQAVNSREFLLQTIKVVYPPSCFRSSGVCELSMFYFVAMFAHLHVSFKRCVWALHVHKIIDGSSSMESQNQSHGGNSGYKPSRRPSMVNCEEVGIDD